MSGVVVQLADHRLAGLLRQSIHREERKKLDMSRVYSTREEQRRVRQRRDNCAECGEVVMGDDNVAADMKAGIVMHRACFNRRK